QAVQDLAAVVAGQGTGGGANPARVAQYRVDVPPARVVGVQGEADGAGCAVSAQQPGGRHDRGARVVDVAVTVDCPGGGKELHGPLGVGAARPGDPAEAGLDEVDRGQVRPPDAGRGLRRLVVGAQRGEAAGGDDPPW